VSGKNANTLFFAHEDVSTRLYKSTDLTSWSNTGLNLGPVMFVDSTNVAYGGLNGGIGVVKSSDGFATYSNPLTGFDITSFSRKSDDSVYYAGTTQGVYVSITPPPNSKISMIV
jgi:hypothetical protein